MSERRRKAPRPLRPRFWERYRLEELTPEEWEALCDGCGKCCLNKLEDAETGEIAFTRVACRLFDDETCRCAQYEIRKEIVPECVVLTPDRAESVHEAGQSLRGRTVPEFEVAEEEWEDHIIEEEI